MLYTRIDRDKHTDAILKGLSFVLFRTRIQVINIIRIFTYHYLILASLNPQKRAEKTAAIFFKSCNL